ncbi:Osmotin thaumatin-like protein [Fomitopsis schrenkii]|uniref:Osmotin thaumatin-like protein n=1 Tax=Fomitopsis schrenkii TaxID=2126942 RepID=S8FYI9_FOMSC|nr:Osmotin thaumatin-like protein [Fomitopsis schrenkii]
MFSRLAVLVTALATLAAANPVYIVNNCDQQIDPAFFPTVQDHYRNPTGGFELPAGEQYLVYLLSGWSGRIWGRTDCDADGNCATGGGCQGGVNCTSPAPAGPTLAQFTIDANGEDYFAPSTVDGFNIPVSIVPQQGCSTGAVSCTGLNEGTGCDLTAACPTLVYYSVIFC